MSLNRRTALKGIGATSITAAGLATPAIAAPAIPRIVIIGGGFGGAIAAGYLRRLMPTAHISLIEANARYTACPFSNLVIGGTRPLEAQQFSYEALTRSGIHCIHDLAIDIDPQGKTVTLKGGDTLTYDRLILSPGVDFRWSALEGYDEAASLIMPHAWKAGPQTRLLRYQLHAMEDGGTVIMSVPRAPFRCPPGPYERASLIAHYLKTQKPKSKLIVLDAKDSFSKMPLFKAAWARNYPDHLEWRGMSNDGAVASVDPSTKTLSTDFEELRADVANVIPPQKAGQIADRAGVTDGSGWCPVNPLSFLSTQQADIHVIGDATIAAPMPKSAFAASLQAKTCAIAIASAFANKPIEASTLLNTCYSFITPDEAISIVGVYSNQDAHLASIPNAGGLTPETATLADRTREAQQARDWFHAITQEAFL